MTDKRDREGLTQRDRANQALALLKVQAGPKGNPAEEKGMIRLAANVLKRAR